MRGLVVISLLVTVGVWGAGSAAARWWWPAWGGWVIGYAAGVNLAACWLAFVPMALVVKRKLEQLPRAVMLATIMRLLLVGLGAVAAAASGPWPKKPLAAWLVVFYLALLAVETTWIVRLVGRQIKTMDKSAKI